MSLSAHYPFLLHTHHLLTTCYLTTCWPPATSTPADHLLPHHLLTSLLYQRTHPSSLQSLTQTPSSTTTEYTQTHTVATKPSNPHNSQPTHPLFFSHPFIFFNATFTNSS
jgi:hypothetical protein